MMAGRSFWVLGLWFAATACVGGPARVAGVHEAAEGDSDQAEPGDGDQPAVLSRHGNGDPKPDTGGLAGNSDERGGDYFGSPPTGAPVLLVTIASGSYKGKPLLRLNQKDNGVHVLATIDGHVEDNPYDPNGLFYGAEVYAGDEARFANPSLFYRKGGNVWCARDLHLFFVGSTNPLFLGGDAVDFGPSGDQGACSDADGPHSYTAGPNIQLDVRYTWLFP
jgi:hypothetical protein